MCLISPASDNTRVSACPRVLLISPHSSYRIAPYIDAAKKLDLDVLVVSQGEHSLVSEVARGLHVDFSAPDIAFNQVVAAVNDQIIAGVVGTDDSTVEFAAKIAQHFGLVHNHPQASVLSRRKDLARAKLADAGIPIPQHQRLNLLRSITEQVSGVVFPCVVKPLALSGSRGVIRVDSTEELELACNRIQSIIEKDDELSREEREHVLLEQFISGPEVALEAILHNGQLQKLALFDKPDPLEGPFFEETYYISPSRLDNKTQDMILQRVQHACDAYGLREGPVHAELRIHNNEVWIMEVAARTIGGQCARLMRFGTGHGLEEMVLAHAIGKPLPPEHTGGGAGVLMIPIPRAGILRRVEGIMRARKVPFIEDIEISVREGYELTPLPEGSSYLGFIFARAPTAGLAEQALRTAHACLNIVTAPAFPIKSAGEV